MSERRPYAKPAVVLTADLPGDASDLDARVDWRRISRKRLDARLASHREARLGDLLVRAVAVFVAHGELDLLEAVLEFVPRCSKGCCMTPATRVAGYGSSGLDGLLEQPSCDRHGIDDGARDYPYAEALRAAETALAAADCPPWWRDDGREDGGNRPPRKAGEP